MKEQNYRNHSRFVPGFHFVTGFAMILLLIGSIINLVNSDLQNLFSASLICLISLIFLSVFWYLRSFALRAQDRAIRAEENFRYFILTGKRLPQGLHINQVIALRFAPDEEFPELAVRALNENLGSSDIKKAIRNWRADHHRA
jgi:hypothetical protein